MSTGGDLPCAGDGGAGERLTSRTYWTGDPFLFQQCETRRKLRGITKEEDEMKRSKYENTGIPKQIGSRFAGRDVLDACPGSYYRDPRTGATRSVRRDNIRAYRAARPNKKAA